MVARLPASSETLALQPVRILYAKEPFCMGYVRNNLLPGESIVYETKAHWKIFLAPAAYLLAGAYLYYLLNDTCTLPGIVVMGVGAFKLIPALFNYFTSEYAVTDKRIILKRGAFSTSSLELPLDKVASVGVDEPLLGRILGYGSIKCSSGADPQKFEDISAPQEFRRQATQQALHP